MTADRLDRVSGDVAWTTYRSAGAFVTGGITRRLEWQETAVLTRGGDRRWRIDRLHSTTVARPSGPP